jgi:hypothetical protein
MTKAKPKRAPSAGKPRQISFKRYRDVFGGAKVNMLGHAHVNLTCHAQGARMLADWLQRYADWADAQAARRGSK